MRYLKDWLSDLRLAGPDLAVRVYPKHKKRVRIRFRSTAGAATAWYHARKQRFDIKVDPDARYIRRCDGIKAGTVVLRALSQDWR